MNRKGFTLVELLGVIIILSLLMLIVLPRITNSTRNSSAKTDKVTEQLIFDAAALYLNDNEGDYNKIEGSVYCIDLNDLVNSDYLKSPLKMSYDGDIVNTKIVEASYNNGYSYKLKDTSNCSGKGLYIDNTLNGTDPEFLQGLTPVLYDGSNWKVASKFEKWYDYSKQEWANAVILKSGVTKTEGQAINVSSDVQAMLVWIPRYEYKIAGTYGKGGTSTSSPGEIEINFISKNATTISSGYRVHPAFTFGSEELNGIWVGKFETTGTAANPTILPSVTSLRSQNVSTQFATAQKFNSYITNGDSHMAKNSEWGAVAYLSQSKYGKYGNSSYSGVEKQVRINNCSSYITGIGADSQNASSSTSTCTTNTYETDKGQTASTTGNITGIYDMSGGSWEYVMGYLSGISETWGATDSSNYAGFTSVPNIQYYELYTSSNASSYDGTLSKTACNGGVCYGHGLSETIGWYGDYTIFVRSNYPWFSRGGYYGSASSVGVFAFGGSNGNASNNTSFRIIISPTTNS